LPNREYILFASPTIQCHKINPLIGGLSSNTDYVLIMLCGTNLFTLGMFPIKNGNVLDLGNDFG